MKREDAINELVEAELESFCHSKEINAFIRDVLRNGISGFDEHDNATLANLYEGQFGEAVTIED